MRRIGRHIKSIGKGLLSPHRRRVKLLLAAVLLLLLGRSLPYLAPIHATDLVPQQQTISFRDRHGLPLGTLLTRDQEHTTVVPLEQISPYFQQAMLAAEDQRFYQHGGVDMLAVGRALLEAVESGKIVSGASTITMQLARMASESAPRTFPTKIQETWRSWRIEAGSSKDEIFHAYLNRLPMGGNLYGVEAAARTYFGVPAADLSLAQATMLAAIPNAPNRFNPYYGLWELKKRQEYILNRMAAEGYISRDRAQKARQASPQLLSSEQGIVAAPHFLFWLSQRLPDSASQVRTTLDWPLQKFVQNQLEQVTKQLASRNVRHGAALVIDNHTGEIRAYVGSPGYFADRRGSNDGVQALRQPGSTLKPFLYELALYNGTIRPNTILADVPTHYPIPGAKVYSPIDYSKKFHGPVRVRAALANSLNVPAVRVLEDMGVESFLQRLRQLGFEHLDKSAEHYGLGLALGSGEVSLWELARAYTRMATEGRIQSLIVKPNKTQARSGSVAAKERRYWRLIVDMLSDRHARATAFGVESVLNLPFPAAVKTGTSSDYRDTWTVGFTSDYTVATWVGNFNGDRMDGVSGVQGAAPLWQRIMLRLHENKEPEPFPKPQKMQQYPICAVTGLKPTSKCNNVVLEYLAQQDMDEYRQPPNNLQLPPEYNNWLAQQKQTRFADALQIVFPQENDYFLMDAEHSSRLKFELAGVPDGEVNWWLLGEGEKTLLSTTESQDSLFWSMRPGNWVLQVKSKEEEKGSQVRFQVQTATSQQQKRGFSVTGETN